MQFRMTTSSATTTSLARIVMLSIFFPFCVTAVLYMEGGEPSTRAQQPILEFQPITEYTISEFG
ncbi:MAG: hypothetical protein BJ554DRAFT_7182 [Olpidium bornovanus]|uniref:Uncharacterized protein n=1 Tax=Olpidium bornovanus TaxID=278681 RepID=A0A8H8DK31_9FUNG|nr:MAG: hypothetical protein BJ554DRAFT_7182 [Olpidium bornovanus]